MIMKKLIHKFPLLFPIIMFWLYSCQREETNLSEPQGTVFFGGISLEFAPIGSQGSRVEGISPWIHIFPNSANLVFTNKLTRDEFVLKYKPNDFSTTYSINLPFGTYEYFSMVEGEVFSSFLPFETSG
jgi:hypothetical protein